MVKRIAEDEVVTLTESHRGRPTADRTGELTALADALSGGAGYFGWTEGKKDASTIVSSVNQWLKAQSHPAKASKFAVAGQDDVWAIALTLDGMVAQTAKIGQAVKTAINAFLDAAEAE